jgi:putative transposase
VARLPLFQKDGDHDAFERVLALVWQRHPVRILAYGLMPNHGHFGLWPQTDGQRTAFRHGPTNTLTMRWHGHYHSGGTGHVYQGRFKSFPVEADDHLDTVLRYVEHNALRGNLVRRAEDWRWCSLGRREANDPKALAILQRLAPSGSR